MTTLRRQAWAALLTAAPTMAFAQARNPFSVGISEGGGPATGFVGWLMAEQAAFERLITTAMHQIAVTPAAWWSLVGLSFAYGVFHAAGPGHGKAVVASYMLAGERALPRGLLVSALAALLQGVVAIALVAILAIGLHATAVTLRTGASLIETVSFAAVAVLGAFLVWRKGRAFAAVVMQRRPALAFAGAPGLTFGSPSSASVSSFACDSCEPGYDASCSHCAPIDPNHIATLDWTGAAGAVVAAGLRPCSGAILVLVFALAQRQFGAGIASVAAMSFGTALTTSALASLAVLFKGLALRWTRPGGWAGAVAVRGLELMAAILVLGLGVALSFGYAAALAGG